MESILALELGGIAAQEPRNGCARTELGRWPILTTIRLQVQLLLLA